jgi:hypothetical protein
VRSLACAAFALAACATAQSRFLPLGPAYPPLADDQEIEVFTSGEPQKPFVKVSRLDVHLEKSVFATSTLQDALPELKRQARLSGAHAIMDVQELRSSVGETRIYHVTATGVRYANGRP